MKAIKKINEGKVGVFLKILVTSLIIKKAKNFPLWFIMNHIFNISNIYEKPIEKGW
tara:strand:- start:1670 stop:1837 length:168 start_codon:yes stop_codon:yes gene_type:complete